MTNLWCWKEHLQPGLHFFFKWIDVTQCLKRFEKIVKRGRNRERREEGGMEWIEINRLPNWRKHPASKRRDCGSVTCPSGEVTQTTTNGIGGKKRSKRAFSPCNCYLRAKQDYWVRRKLEAMPAGVLLLLFLLLSASTNCQLDIVKLIPWARAEAQDRGLFHSCASFALRFKPEFLESVSEAKNKMKEEF